MVSLLVAAMLEMYVQGVSTRKVKNITEELCGHEFSSSSVSRIVKTLDEEWRSSPGGGSKSRIRI
jgi:putative transposase